VKPEAVVKKIKVSRYDMKGSGRAREFGESESFIKVIVHTKTNRILGAAVLASEGAELVHLYVGLMNADAPYTVIRDAIHIHPTLVSCGYPRQERTPSMSRLRAQRIAMINWPEGPQYVSGRNKRSEHA